MGSVFLSACSAFGYRLSAISLRRQDGKTARRQDGKTARKNVVEESRENFVLSPFSPLSEATPSAQRPPFLCRPATRCYPSRREMAAKLGDGPVNGSEGERMAAARETVAS